MGFLSMARMIRAEAGPVARNVKATAAKQPFAPNFIEPNVAKYHYLHHRPKAQAGKSIKMMQCICSADIVCGRAISPTRRL